MKTQELETIKQEYQNKQIPLAKVIQLLKRSEQQTQILLWSPSQQDAATFFKEHFNCEEFDIYSGKRLPSKTKLKKSLATISAFLKEREKNAPSVNISVQERYLNSLNDPPNDPAFDGVEKKAVLNWEEFDEKAKRITKKNYPFLTRFLTIYSFIPEFFWSFIPRKKNGDYRKGAVACFWRETLGEWEHDEYEGTQEFGIYLKHHGNNKMNIEICPRAPVSTNYFGKKLIEALEE